jgi:hypothetical protein
MGNSGSEKGKVMIGDLEKLVKFAVYEASFNRLSKNRSPKDNQYDPIVDIHNPLDPNGKYEGTMIVSKNERVKDFSKSIRDDLIEKGRAKPFNVLVIHIGKTHFLETEYTVIATPDKPSIIKVGYDMQSEMAFSVLIGEQTFYSRYISNDKKHKMPFLLAYKYNNGNPIRKVGILEPNPTEIVQYTNTIEFSNTERKSADRILAEEIIHGSQRIRGLNPGNHLIVREIGESQKGSTLFFEPVINFTEYDDATSPNGDKLITRVEGYNQGDMIYNLPIPAMERSKSRGSQWYIGYVRSPEAGTYYYKPVKFKDVRDRVGRYIEKAEIIKNCSSFILARRLLPPSTLRNLSRLSKIIHQS